MSKPESAPETQAVSPGRLRALRPEDLRPSFATLAVTPPKVSSIVGQERAREALEFGLQIDAPGYGIVVSGQSSSGRTALVRELVSAAARTRPRPPDWIYLHNFADPRRPRCVKLPAGRAVELARRMQELMEACRDALPAAFESESYESRVRQAIESIGREREKEVESLQSSARRMGLVITPTHMGMMAAPLGPDGRPMSGEALAKLPDHVRQPLEARMEQVQEAVITTLRKLRHLETQARESVLALDREATRFVIGPILDDLKRDFGANDLAGHLASIEEDVVANVEIFKRFAGLSSSTVPDEVVRQFKLEREAILRRYQVNLFVVQELGEEGAPVVEERQPSYLKLLGRVEFENQMGVMVTDFLHIRPGAIHRANGGFLLLQAEDVLADPRMWARLKATLRTEEIGVEDLSETLAIPVAGLLPERAELRVKVVLIGRPLLLAILDALDPDFHELFKVRAEFEPDMRADESSISHYAGFVDSVIERKNLLPFDPEAMTEILQLGCRLAGRQDRLTARLGLIEDFCTEASVIASRAGAGAVTAEHLQAALSARERRSGLLADRIRALIADGRLHVATSGRVEGQVNGLALLAAGDHAFGLPTRITCRAGAGQQGIVDIERETERSGALHTKGVLVLSGFLMGTFGRTIPLSFNASLTFEQSYDEVEGDSASAAELLAILTALASVPVRQDIAVTGSIDQLGNIQAVGGVTQKVEGFYEVCSEAGLTGAQGVVIPSANAIDLCLRPELVESVRGGQFGVWSASRIEDILELATGIPAGERDERGIYPEGSLFRMVADRLKALHRTAATANMRFTDGAQSPPPESG